MSIAPPSDIILDVAQAADPLKLQAAKAKLAGAAAGADVDFGETLGALPASSAVSSAPLPAVTIGAEGTRIDAGKPASVGRKFEAMVLQNFIENILPKDNELFGDAASADMGRTLLAEKVADQLARSGRIGIAKSLERFQDRTGTGAPADPHPLAAPALPTLPAVRG